MESEIARFLKDASQLNMALLLCFYTVRDGLRIPAGKTAFYSVSFATLFCVLITVVYANIDAGILHYWA